MSSPAVRRGPSRALRALLGIVAIALFIAAVGGTWVFLEGGFQSGARVTAVFSDDGVGQQLPEGGDVKVRGVLVGRIDDIVLATGGSVRVEMLLNSDGLDLPAATRAQIGSKTLFGEKWIELLPTDDTSGPRLAAGDTIPDSRTDEPLELETQLQLGSDLLSAIPLNDLATLLDTLAEGFGGSEKDARNAIDDGLIALRAVNDRTAELDLSLSQLNEFSQWLDDNDSQLLSFMESVDSANRALVGAAPAFRSSIDSVPVFLNDLAAFQETTAKDLGRLVENGATVAEIVAERNHSLIDLVVQLEAFLTVWNSGLRQPCAGLYDHDLTCWQVYLAPGIDSRGLYSPDRRPPNDNEPGDPGNGRIGRSIDETSLDQFEDLLRDASGQEVPSDLAELLYAPALEASRDLDEDP
ncbi:MAG: MlaD family protein [Actinomycetota bacterium]